MKTTSYNAGSIDLKMMGEVMQEVFTKCSGEHAANPMRFISQHGTDALNSAQLNKEWARKAFFHSVFLIFDTDELASVNYQYDLADTIGNIKSSMYVTEYKNSLLSVEISAQEAAMDKLLSEKGVYSITLNVLGKKEVITGVCASKLCHGSESDTKLFQKALELIEGQYPEYILKLREHGEVFMKTLVGDIDTTGWSNP